MIPFQNPHLLWLLWLVPAVVGLLVWAGARRRAALFRLADAHLLSGLIPPPSPARSWLRSTLLAGAVTSFVLALGGPWWGFHWEDVARRGVDVVVALDLSRSMLAQDLKPDRLSAAKREIKDLLDLLQGDRIGLVVFSGVAYIQVPLTLDTNAVELFLDQLDTDTVPIGGTNLADAVRKGVQAFAPSDRAGRAILLITDGEDHGDELARAAEEAKREGVHVYVLGIGDPAGAPMPDGQGGFIEEDGKIVLSKLGESELMDLATNTGGAYVRAVAGDLDLRGIYVDGIRSDLVSREQQSTRKRREEERFQWPLSIGILLLVLESLLAPVRRNATPALALALALSAPGAAHAGFWPAWLGGGDPLEQGHEAYQRGDFQGALDRWLQAQVDHPADRRIDYDVGMASYRLSKYPEAEEAFLRAASTGETALAADALHNAGNAAFQQGKFQEAMAHYDKALALRPQDPDTQANRDLAQRRYEEMLEEAKKQQEERSQEEQEKQNQQQQSPGEDQEPGQGEGGQGQEGQQDPQQQGQDGEQQRQEQQKGQGQSQQQSQQEGQGQGEEGATPQGAPAEGAGGDPEKEAQEAQQGGQAAAADIQRDGQEAATPAGDGVVGSQTQGQEGQGQAGAARPGSLTKAQAEALLDALKQDQQRRRKERTQREGQRGRRAAGKDW
jgi:Ca-activated chloride channel family protein